MTTNLQAVSNTASAPSHHRAELDRIRASLKSRFLERDDVIDGLLVALLAKQHALLLGQPGTAKSDLARDLAAHVSSPYFQWLLTKFTTPEELYGPYSLKDLEQGIYRRITTGKMPEAQVAFVDETFKASSAILNTMLTLMNERLFYNAAAAVPCPLQMLIGASNEMPEGDELEALYDRFMLRFWVKSIEETDNELTLMTMAPATAPQPMSMADLAQAQADVFKVVIPDTTLQMLQSLFRKVKEAGIYVSDRRKRQMMHLLRARAYLDGSDVVTEDHLDVVQHALWRDPKEIGKAAELIASVGNPFSVTISEVIAEVKKQLTELGTCARGATPAEKGEWATRAATVSDALDGRLKDLQNMAKTCPPKNKPRLDAAIQLVAKASTDISKRTTDAFKTK